MNNDDANLGPIGGLASGKESPCSSMTVLVKDRTVD
jgi:hypothetical protein